MLPFYESRRHLQVKDHSFSKTLWFTYWSPGVPSQEGKLSYSGLRQSHAPSPSSHHVQARTCHSSFMCKSPPILPHLRYHDTKFHWHVKNALHCNHLSPEMETPSVYQKFKEVFGKVKVSSLPPYTVHQITAPLSSLLVLHHSETIYISLLSTTLSSWSL